MDQTYFTNPWLERGTETNTAHWRKQSINQYNQEFYLLSVTIYTVSVTYKE